MKMPGRDRDSGDLRIRIGALLESGLDRGALLRELSLLVTEPGFEACADLWAPTLYARDPNFFGRFLLRHLDAHEADVIRALLPRIETDGQTELFHSLYSRVIRPEAWNADLLELAGRDEPDDRVLAAVERRRMSGYWFVLNAETALALYQRNPALFAGFVADSVQAGPELEDEDEAYAVLLEEARRRGDEPFYWRIFRQVADPHQWAEAARRLLAEPVPSDAILTELRRRHPVYARDLDASVLAELLEKYRESVLPYIEENAEWITRKGAPLLLAAAERLRDAALYWRVFFRVGNSRQWNASLLELAKEMNMPQAEWAAELFLRTPPADADGHWSLGAETALALYRRDAGLARPLIERWMEQSSVPLFEAATQAGDEDMLDLLTTHVLWHLAWMVYDAYPTASEQRYKKVHTGAAAEVERWGRTIAERLDRLYAASPTTYVEHAARILSRVDRSSGWSFRRNLQHNPVFIYLYSQHHAAWLADPAALRELLETPNLITQGIALEILSETVPEAADRTVDNLTLLRAVLLGDAGVGFKKRVIAVLEKAAGSSRVHADAVVPAIHEAMYFSAKKAIPDRAMVSYVRVRSRFPVEVPSTALPDQP